MDLLSKYGKDRVYCDRIKESSYTQNKQDKQNNANPIFPTIVDLFFSRFDHHYSLVENKDKQLYVKQLIINIATEIDENKSNKYDNFTNNDLGRKKS